VDRWASCHETESFVLPSLDTANHLLDPPAEARQACGRAVGAVAVRSAAVHDKERVGRVRGQIPLVDLSVRQIDCAGHVPCLERLWSTHVEQDEVLRIAAERGMDVPAVGFEGQQGLEVCAGADGIGGGQFGDS